mmetsp:Transcript_27733/g.53711  ORF Transcript_27733/g.53711 Transcript_27733/m.53711 type:complete len:612 (+) Transcript_27733:160-1995(+)
MTTSTLLLPLVLLASHDPPTIQSFQPPSLLPTLLPLRSPRTLFPSTSPSTTTTSSATTTALPALSQRQSFLLDGGELESFLLYNPSPQQSSSTATATAEKVFRSPRNSPRGIGCLTFVTGTTEEDRDGEAPNEGGGAAKTNETRRRIIGVEATSHTADDSTEKSATDSHPSYETISLGNNIRVYEHTAATIPEEISDWDAISTAAAAVVGIHCAVPRVGGVGGSEVEFTSGKAVVIGGNDYACFIANGLATLGVDVSIVSTGGVNVKHDQVQILSPSVDSEEDDGEEVGFATAIGKFDSLIDTISNERKGIANLSATTGGSTVIQMLRTKNQCHRYISTLTKSQQLIKDEGVFFGPGKANAHVKYLESLSPQKCTTLIPSSGFGPSTLQTLLENNILFSFKNSNKAIFARGWTMKDFWEEASWPRDSSGTGVRYGFVTEEEEDLDALFRAEQLQMQQRRPDASAERTLDPAEEAELDEQATEDRQNPYVKQIIGVEGLAEHVTSQRKSCVVFVAMRSCRTCKGINPVFTKIAREHGSNLMFAKADATGGAGKALGRQLGVDAVPSFVLFRNGIRYGAVSTSKLPSEKLTKAIVDLEAGKDFDLSLQEDDDD